MENNTEPGTDSDSDAPPEETTDTDTDDPADTDEQPQNPHAEAKKWRKQLRAAQAERDTLAARLETLQRNTVEQQAETAGVKAAAVWATAELPALLDDDGNVSAELVTQAIESARNTLGITPIGKGGKPIPGVGERPQTHPKDPAQEFTAAFGPKRP
jgi:hypothetical protein